MDLERKSKEAFWYKHCINWKNSKQTQVEYCAQEEISVHTFRKYVCFFNKKKHTKAKSRFVTLEKQAETTIINQKSDDKLLSSPLKLHIANRFCIEIPRYFSEATLAQTIKVIESL